MYILIAGAGVLGKALIKELIRDNNVVVIDLNQEECERVYSKYGALSVYGNATQIHVLKEAGIEKCDVAIATMDKDSDNLAFTVLAKNYGVEKILVRMRNPEYKSAYKLAGATNVGEVTNILIDNFVNDIKEPMIKKLISLGNGKAEISIITIPEKCICAGKTISEIVNYKGFPEDCVIAGIYDQEQDKLVIPRGNTEIYAQNQLFLVATRGKIKEAVKILTKA